MEIKIALAGELPQDPRVSSQVDLLIGQIGGRLCRDGAQAEIRVLMSPAYTGEGWAAWVRDRRFPVSLYEVRSGDVWDGPHDRTVRRDTVLRDLAGQALCDRADVAVAVWNEDVAERSGAVWELLRIAYGRKTPCIWISSRSGEVYCLWDSYYRSYSPQYLETVCTALGREAPRPAPLEPADRVTAFWERRRARYLKRHRAEGAVYPPQQDHLLEETFQMEPEAAGGEEVRARLLDRFRLFDDAAVEANGRFRAMLYQRSVLPFIATAFLAVGFYAETLLGKTLSGLIPSIAAGATLAAGLLAGAGFLIHGLLNLYAFRLSRSRRISRWQREFVGSRFRAELLRVLIHFLPYGVDVDLRTLCGGDMALYNDLKHLTDGAEPPEQTVDRTTVRRVLRHISELLADQIDYHRASAARYRSVVSSLDRWGQRIFLAGFLMVTGRGALQFVLALSPIADVGGVDVNGIVRSFLNMLALMLPGWAGYFSTKAQQNNFRYDLQNHERTLEKLEAMQERVLRMLRQEEAPLEIFDGLAEELVEIVLVEDTAAWQRQYLDLSVKPL